MRDTHSSQGAVDPEDEGPSGRAIRRDRSELKVLDLTLRGVSVGGIATCLLVPELDLMFDVGVPVPGMVGYDTILVTHGHQDHLGALPYLVSQRQLMRRPPPRVHIPEEIEAPLRRIFSAWSEIEDFELEPGLVPHRPGDAFELGKGRSASCVRSAHRVPSLAWIVHRTTMRLRPEFLGRPGPEIAELRRGGHDVTFSVKTPLLCVTGDTTIDLFLREEIVRRATVLVHEVTSFDDRRSVEETRAWGHTHIDELVAHVDRFQGEALVLVHRSARHSRADVERIVQERFPASVRDRVHVFP